jgi:tetratricopeptide (TPR) repeat protein
MNSQLLRYTFNFALLLLLLVGCTAAIDEGLDKTDFAAEATAVPTNSPIPATPIPTPTAPAPEDLAAVYIERANAYMDAEQWSEAITEYTTALALYPNAVLYLQRGRANVQLERLDDALADIAEAIALDPEYYDAFMEQGDIYLRLENNTRAFLAYNQAVELDPQSLAALHGRGDAYFNMGEFAYALTDYEMAAALDPNNDLLHVRCGKCNLYLGNYVQAHAAFKQAILLNEQNDEAFLGRANVHDLLGMFKEAIADYDQAIALNPHNPIFFHDRGISYQEQNNPEEAIANFSQAILLASADDSIVASCYLKRGANYHRIGEITMAIADFTQAILLDPDGEGLDALGYRGNIYHYVLQDYDLALADFNQLIALDRMHASAYYNRALVYLQIGEMQKGKADLRMALQLGLPPESQQTAQAILDNIGKVFQTETFSVQTPNGAGWIGKQVAPNRVLFTSERWRQVVEINVQLNWVNPGIPGVPEPLTADYIAEDYSEYELEAMLQEVLRQDYELENVNKGTIEIGDKTFYYMTFLQIVNEEKAGVPLILDGCLYLYFPEDFSDSRIFFTITVKDRYLRDQPRTPMTEAELHGFLANFSPLPGDE